MEWRRRREVETRSACRGGAPFLRRASSTHHIRNTCRATYRSCGHSSDRRIMFLFSFKSILPQRRKDAKFTLLFFAPLREKLQKLFDVLSRTPEHGAISAFDDRALQQVRVFDH